MENESYFNMEYLMLDTDSRKSIGYERNYMKRL
jgi:hypothetical protein